MDIHFIREKVARGQVRVLHVPSRYQIADIFTKGLPRLLFQDFRDSLSVREPPASTAAVKNGQELAENYLKILNNTGQELKLKEKRRMMKKKRKTEQENYVFGLILSSLLSKKSDTNELLIKKCLNKIFHSIPNLLTDPVLSLIPVLLKSSSCLVACKTAEIIGAASLVSFEMNERLCSEDEIVKGLISLLRSSKREVVMASCNAMLDILTTSIGQRRLLELSAVDNVIHCFVQAYKSSAAINSGTGDMIFAKEDEYLFSLLQCAVSLINACTFVALQSIPEELSIAFLACLKGLWVQTHNQSLCGSSSKFDKMKDSYVSKIVEKNLAESIFKLSIYHCSYLEPIDVDWFDKTILNSGEITTEKFLCTIWELNPIVIREASNVSRKQNDIFVPFLHYLGPKNEIPTSLPSILKPFISCPPISSDELNIFHVMDEIKNYLGCPLKYQQDIRVVKTSCRGEELHCFQEQCFSINEISKCGDAFVNGYSIALRGLEFRFQSLAAIANGLSSFFGQPSVGINMYLTPPNSQGLARHSDDHCVFVCQLIGAKKWKVLTRPTTHLPRLYENFDGSCGLEVDDKCQEFLVNEGDIFYIPRGFPHEARTYVDEDKMDDNVGFSLHLTFAVEIEPPFEWEGFMHVAVHSWEEKQKALQCAYTDPSPLHAVFVKLLHIAIKLHGNLDSTFRKACLVGSMSISLDWLHGSQTTIFKYLINRIITESKLSDIVQYVEAAIQKNEDPFEHVRWMVYLTVDGEAEKSNRYMLDLLVQNQDIAESVWMKVRNKFCNEVEFEDVKQNYKVLLEMYRKVRKQYGNGMMSLHCTVGQ